MIYYTEGRALVQDKSHNASRNLEEITWAVARKNKEQKAKLGEFEGEKGEQGQQSD